MSVRLGDSMREFVFARAQFSHHVYLVFHALLFGGCSLPDGIGHKPAMSLLIIMEKLRVKRIMGNRRRTPGDRIKRGEIAHHVNWGLRFRPHPAGLPFLDPPNVVGYDLV